MLHKTNSTRTAGTKTRSREAPTEPHPSSFSTIVRHQLSRASSKELWLASDNPFIKPELDLTIAAYADSLAAHGHRRLADRIRAITVVFHHSIDVILRMRLHDFNPATYPYVVQLLPGPGMTTAGKTELLPEGTST